MPPPPATWSSRRIQEHILTWPPERVCPHCHVQLLSCETPGFCCGKQGEYFFRVSALPPLPEEYSIFLDDPNLSSSSRILNLIYSFAALETTHDFPVPRGGPSFMAIQGKVYHRLRPQHRDSGIRWILYDGYLASEAPHFDWASSLPTQWKEAVASALLRLNPFSRALQSLANNHHIANARVIVAASGASEIAAIFDYSNTSDSELDPRSLIISRNNGSISHIPTVSKMWEPLVYPLLFPHGSLGWGINQSDHDENHVADGEVDLPTTQIWHYRARLLREERFSIFGRLTNEYVVDMWTRVLESRLHYIRMNQTRIRQADAALMGLEDVEDNENIFLPASFLGSRRWASEQVADALTIAAEFGVATFFITFTCNPEWPEIQTRLRPGQKYTDVPVVVARVFHGKLSALLRMLRRLFPNSGPRLYTIHTVEFQLRGLPHAHILIKFQRDCLEPDDIDAIVSAEMPPDPNDAALVSQFMIHNHSQNSTYCMRSNPRDPSGPKICRFRYPHALQNATTIDVEGRVHYRRRRNEDSLVVPYCLPLLRAFKCHINFEVANTSHIFQYLYKYIHKGPDRTRFRITDDDSADRIDEIEEFWSGRYLSATEATWRIFGFHITRKTPSVTSLPVHLPGCNRSHQYIRADGSGSKLSLLDRYFHRPHGIFTIDHTPVNFASLTYREYYRLFRLTKFDKDLIGTPGTFLEHDIPPAEKRMCVIRRTPTRLHLTRLTSVRPTEGERFYLRVLLDNFPYASFDDALHAHGVRQESFQAVCTELGVFADEKEAVYAMNEAVNALRTPLELRILFVHLLLNACCLEPLQMWQDFRDSLSQDFYLQSNANWTLGHDQALQHVAQLLEADGHTLNEYGLPTPVMRANEVLNEMQRWGGNVDILTERVESALDSFNNEQRLIFDLVVHAVETATQLLIFVDGKAGTGKTFLINTICDWIRSTGRIVIPTASSAFAAQLYPGGRTTHVAFKVPVNDNSEQLLSPIRPNSQRGQLIQHASAYVIDEAGMLNRAVLGCVEDCARRVTGSDSPFGGKTFILLGDFRQTCPVVRKGTRAQVINASIRSSPLWPLFQVRRLITPVRNSGDPAFADYVDSIGDGAGPEVTLSMILPLESSMDLIDFVFPSEVLDDPTACLTRSILAPTNLQIDEYNRIIVGRIDGPQRTYLAADSLREAEEAGIVAPESSVLDFAARQTPPGLPAHQLTIKVNAVYRLLRNFSLDRGLVKNVRCVVVDVGTRIVTVRILRKHAGINVMDTDNILIPRITFTADLPSGHTLLRRQFPLAPAYATTFNSCQGLTLDRIGIDLTRPVFSHGQLYTAISRVRHRSHARVLFRPGETQTPNVTYPEILL